MTFADAITGYFLEKRRNFSVHTVEDYQRTFRRFAAHVGAIDVAAITPTHVRSFLNQMIDAERAAKTVANAWIALSSFWTWAEHELEIPHIIRDRVACPDWKSPAIQPYTAEELSALLAACANGRAWATRRGGAIRSARPNALRERAIIITLVDTGLRAQELCDLTIANYNDKTGALLVLHGKNDKQRLVYCGVTARTTIWTYLVSRPDARPTHPLFATHNNTHILTDNLLNSIQRIADVAGVKNATIHRFRHTFAITFLRNGGSVLALQALLGHERMETVRIYAKLAQIDLQQAQRNASPADNWRL